MSERKKVVMLKRFLHFRMDECTSAAVQLYFVFFFFFFFVVSFLCFLAGQLVVLSWGWGGVVFCLFFSCFFLLIFIIMNNIYLDLLLVFFLCFFCFCTSE